jgi:hypothetical protein
MMKKTKMNKSLWLLIVAAGLSACVTINIYFPAAAAEKAADKIIEEVWQLKDGQKVPADKSTEKPAEAPAEKPADTPAEAPTK